MIIPWTFSPQFLFASKWTIIKQAEMIGLRPKEVMLTFDDGPNALFDVTTRLLDILHAEQIPGTFCVIGNHAQQHPELIRRIMHEGHTLAFHSMQHTTTLWWSNLSRILEEFEHFNHAIRQIINQPQYVCAYYRPPFGLITPTMEKALALNEKRLVPITFYRPDPDALPSEADKLMEAIEQEIRHAQRAAIVIHECREDKYLKPDLTEDSPFSINKHWVPEKIRHLIHQLKHEHFTFIGMAELASRTRPIA